MMFLKRIPFAVYAVVGAVAILCGLIGGIGHAWRVHYKSGVKFGADSVQQAAAREVITYQLANTALQSELTTAQATRNVAKVAVSGRVIRAKAATDAIYAAINEQSELARSDSSAQHVVQRALALAAANDSLVRSVEVLTAAQAITDSATVHIHVADSAAVHNLQVVNTLLTGQLVAVTRQRDARPTKKKVAGYIIASASAGAALGKYVVPKLAKVIFK